MVFGSYGGTTLVGYGEHIVGAADSAFRSVKAIYALELTGLRECRRDPLPPVLCPYVRGVRFL